jgi:hypothetical protein
MPAVVKAGGSSEAGVLRKQLQMLTPAKDRIYNHQFFNFLKNKQL